MSKIPADLHKKCETGVIRAKDAIAQGYHPMNLKRLEQKGLLVHSGWGIYTPISANITEHHGLVEATQRVPKGVICLLSALSFHELTTQIPFETWLAIAPNARHPKDKLLSLRILHMSGEALKSGIESHEIEGVTVRIYCLAKTIVDCFKYRNKIGLDVAIEVLRECLRAKCCTVDELWHYAKICRMSNVMRPYLEAIA